MFSLDKKSINYRKPEDKQILIIFVAAGGFASDANLMHNIKPVAVQYHLESDQFLSIDNSEIIIPFISSYIYPGWNIFELTDIDYKNNFINAIKQSIETRLN